MPPESLRSSIDELLHAKLEALLAECDLIDSNEHTLDNMEYFFFDKGRKFLQEAFQEKLQERVQQVETTIDAKQCPHCKKNAIQRCENEKSHVRSRTRNPRTLLPPLSSLQNLLLSRRSNSWIDNILHDRTDSVCDSLLRLVVLCTCRRKSCRTRWSSPVGHDRRQNCKCNCRKNCDDDVR